MSKIILNFPCLCYHLKSKRLYFIKESEFAKVSSGGSSFYKNLVIIDCKGNKYTVVDYKENGFASFKDCLLSLQLLQKIEIELQFIEIISFENLKNLIIEYIKWDKSFSASKYSGIPLMKQLDEAKTIKELILFIK